MRPRSRVSKLVKALVYVCLAAAPGAWATSASGSPVASLRPAIGSGGASPFKLAGSTAHGIAVRRGAAGLHAAQRFAGVGCATSCSSQLLDNGGPVLHDPIKYAIYWTPSTPSSNGQVATSFTPFPRPEYETTIDGFLSNVAAASGTLSNVYSVDQLYAGGGPGEYRSVFGQAFLDTHQYPARNTTTCPVSVKPGDLLPPASQPCISDSEGAPQMPEEIVRLIEEYDKANPLTPLTTGLNAIYFVFTPKEVNSCAGSEGGVAACNTNKYCAYHSAFLMQPSKKIVVYSNMPYDAVQGCSTPDEPHKSPADDEINTLSHEDNEAITDPLGSAWFDGAGNEVGDKCTFPFFDPTIDGNVEVDAYGPLLGGVPFSSEPGTAYNQLIQEGTYLLQREWSNAAAGCVTQAPVPVASFAVYSSPATVGRSVSFNGSSSSPSAGAVTGYRWDFGDGSSTAVGSEVSHTYGVPGQFTVRLTVTNNSGASATATQSVTVNAPSPAEEQVTTVTKIVATPPPNAVTASMLAAAIGLPSSGTALSGVGTIAFGRAACPPACGITLRLYTTVRATRRHRTTVKQVLIGALTTSVAPNGTRALAVTLNDAGRKLLSKGHKLSARLSLTVVGQEGGSWQISRTLTLTSSGKAARHGRRG
jgi:PKD repeat protein